MRPLPIGIDDFKKLRENNYYYVDKTMFISKLLDRRAEVSLFTRPSRFGKSLCLSMLRYFFEREYNQQGGELDNCTLFKGLKIMSSGEEYIRHMGRYPVIYLSLKSAKQPDFEMAYAAIIDEISKEYVRHNWILQSDLLLEEEKEQYIRIRSKKAANIEYAKALDFLSQCLNRVYQKKVIILIDEYDVPLENAYFKGFYDRMTDFIRSLFESALKTNSNMEFAVVTGCLRISRESIFTGLNNLRIISILNANYAEHFGFTESEVLDILQAYGIGEKKAEVKAWYDGYRFGNIEVYNPWSILLYVDDMRSDPKSNPKAYWANTSSNDIVREMVEHADSSVRQELEDLLDGGIIEKPVHEDITYGEIYNSQDNLWNFLFFTGYLKKVREHFEQDTTFMTLAIPNAEIKYIYKHTILDWFNKRICTRNFSELYGALLQKDAVTIERELSINLMETISFYDYKEDYYHGYIAGLLKMLKGYVINPIGRTDWVGVTLS